MVHYDDASTICSDNQKRQINNASTVQVQKYVIYIWHRVYIIVVFSKKSNAKQKQIIMV